MRGDRHVAAVAPPDHCADPPASIAAKHLNAVHSAIKRLAASRTVRLVRAQHMRDVAELARLAPDLSLPEARHRSGVDHRLEVHAIRIEIELEHAVVIHAHEPRTGREDLALPRPAGPGPGLE